MLPARMLEVESVAVQIQIANRWVPHVDDAHPARLRVPTARGIAH